MDALRLILTIWFWLMMERLAKGDPCFQYWVDYYSPLCRFVLAYETMEV